MLIYHGPELRLACTDKTKDMRWKRENGVVIVKKKMMTAYNIEPKTTLNIEEHNRGKAFKQRYEVKIILEETCFLPRIAALSAIE